MLQKWGPTCETEPTESHESREVVLLLFIIALFTARSEIGRTGFFLSVQCCHGILFIFYIYIF